MHKSKNANGMKVPDLAAFQGVRHRTSSIWTSFFIHENLFLSPALVGAGKPSPECRDAGGMLRTKENTASYCCKDTAELEKAHSRGGQDQCMLIRIS